MIWTTLQASLGTTERLVASVLVVLAVLGVRYAVRTYRADRQSEFGALRRLTLSTAIATVTAAGVLALVAVWGLSGELLAAYDRLDLAEQVPNIVLAVVILGGAYALTDFSAQIIRDLVAVGETISDHQREVLQRLTQLGIYAVAFLVVLGLFTDNLGGLLVGAGFLGIVVGMAARKTLGAVVAGIVLMFSRPFEVGDWVQIGEYEGTVTDITIVNTRMRSFDGEYVTIPNDEVGGNPVVDRSKRGRLRIEIEVGIDYDDDPERAADVALEAVEGLEEILGMPAPKVVAKRFDDSGIVLGVRVWIDEPSARKRWRTQTAVINAVHEAFAEEGITIPFPQRTIGSREGTTDATVDDADPGDGRPTVLGKGASGGGTNGRNAHRRTDVGSDDA